MMLVEDEPRRNWDLRVPMLKQLTMAALPPGAMDLVAEHVMDHFMDQVDADAVYFAPPPIIVPEEDLGQESHGYFDCMFWMEQGWEDAMCRATYLASENAPLHPHPDFSYNHCKHQLKRGRPHQEYTEKQEIDLWFDTTRRPPYNFSGNRWGPNIPEARAFALQRLKDKREPSSSAAGKRQGDWVGPRFKRWQHMHNGNYSLSWGYLQ